MKKKLVFILIFVVFAIFFIVVTSPYNLGVNTDSVSYIEVAQNIAKGNGIVNNTGDFVNHWPPFYPLVLGSVSYVVGLDVLHVGVYINLFLFLFYATCFLLILQKFKIRYSLRVLFFIMLLFSIPTTEYFIFLSEGLFTSILVSIVLVLILWLRLKSFKLLIFAGFLSGGLLLTRYAGVGFIVGFITVIFLFSKVSFLKKILEIVVYILPICIIVSMWLVYSSKFETEVIDRKLIWHVIEVSKFKFALSVIYDWFIGHVFFAILFLFFGIVVIFKWKRLKAPASIFNNRLLLFILLPVITYIAFIILSISFFDAHTPLDYRILMPIYFLVLVAIALIFNSNILFDKLPKLRFFMVIVLTFSIIVSAIQPWKNHYENGIGLTSKLWNKSDALIFLKNYNDVPLFSNGLDVVNYFSETPCNFIPRKFDSNLNASNPNFKQEVALMKLSVEQKQKQILYLDKITWRSYLMSKSELLNVFKGFEVIYFEDGFLIK